MNVEQVRTNMIECQIKPWNVPDQAVLDLFTAVHREDFIPDEYKRLAYADLRISLAHDQITMTPKVEARLLHALEIQSTDNVLEIGTGCAYLTALLARSAQHVLSVDIHPAFSIQAKGKLKRYDIDNVTLKSGDGSHGWASSAPYNVIVLTGSVPILGDDIQQQLAPGGRMFAIIGQSPAMKATLIKRLDGGVAMDILFETDFPPLEGLTPVEAFEF